MLTIAKIYRCTHLVSFIPVKGIYEIVPGIVRPDHVVEDNTQFAIMFRDGIQLNGKKAYPWLIEQDGIFDVIFQQGFCNGTHGHKNDIVHIKSGFRFDKSFDG